MFQKRKAVAAIVIQNAFKKEKEKQIKLWLAQNDIVKRQAIWSKDHLAAPFAFLPQVAWPRG